MLVRPRITQTYYFALLSDIDTNDRADFQTELLTCHSFEASPILFRIHISRMGNCGNRTHSACSSMSSNEQVTKTSVLLLVLSVFLEREVPCFPLRGCCCVGGAWLNRNSGCGHDDGCYRSIGLNSSPQTGRQSSGFAGRTCVCTYTGWRCDDCHHHACRTLLQQLVDPSSSRVTELRG
jgi:hypothetical protein